MGFLTASLLKEQSTPEIYLVYAGQRFWIPSPADFTAMGFDWNKVRVVPDGTLSSLGWLPFTIPVATRPSDVFDLPVSTSLVTALNQNCKDPASRIAKHILIAGWLTPEPPDVGTIGFNKGRCLNAIEDCLYGHLTLDFDFLLALYGPGGLSTALWFAMLHGNPAGQATPLPISSASDSRGMGIDLNSLILAGNFYGDLQGDPPHPGIHVELNCWHVTAHPESGCGWTPNGRNQPPGWIVQGLPEAPDAYWPFDPLNPDGRTNPDGSPKILQWGDFVIIRGTLWQDKNHGGNPPTVPVVFGSAGLAGQDGWMEIHPMDWLQRLPPPPMPSTAVIIRLSDQQPVRYTVLPNLTKLATSLPTVLDASEYIDRRYSDMTTVDHHVVTNLGDHVEIDAALSSGSGRYKSIVNVQFEARPCAALANGAHLSLFRCAGDKTVWTIDFDPDSQVWGKWLPMGFATNSGIAAANFNGLMWAGARGLPPRDAMYYQSWNPQLPPPNAAWTHVDGAVSSTPAMCASAGSLHWFIRGENQDMLYNRVDATGKWQGWISMGGIATSSPSATVLNGSIWVMVRGTDGALYYKSWSTPEPPVPAVAWTRIPGVFSSSPAIVADGNRIHLFVRGPDLDILYSPYDGTQWGEFASLGGLATSSPAVGMVSWMKDIPSHLPAGLHGPPMQREAQALFVFIAGPGDKILYSAWYSEFSIAIAPVSTNWEAVPGF